MIPVNQQPIEKPAADNGVLEIVDVFDTIQGEGPFAGTPAAFVRLAGCNLCCPLCDTDYTSRRQALTPAQVAARVAKIDRRLVVLTGGEPFRQSLDVLIELLERDRRQIQIETNGTLWRPVPKSVTVVCSPKTPKVHQDVQRRANFWKYVLREGQVDPSDGLPTSALGMAKPPARPWNMSPAFRAKVMVQPCDEQDPDRNRLNLEAAVESCMRFGYRLTCQLHKTAGLP